MVISINSDDHIPTEQSFKLSAGPGAGKTHWLSQHINDVIAHGSRLGITRKVACISYTNVGADTIKDRLIGAADCVDVCTIHSFLYNNIVKPFLHLESKSFGLDPEKMKVVPKEPFLTEAFAQLSLNESNSNWIGSCNFLNALKECKWQYVNHMHGEFKPNYAHKIKNSQGKEYYIPNAVYCKYVTYRWSLGYVTYDDIIFLASELLRRQPSILNIIKAKYPYFFIDEFQDSIPPIIDFVKTLGQNGIVVGVVGDKAQTIYDFIGASVSAFDSFSIPKMVEYEIHGNRRSTEQIIKLLNIVRPDFQQYSVNGLLGPQPCIVVGDKFDAYQKIKEKLATDDIHTLAYPRILSNSMNFQIKENPGEGNLIDEDFDPNFVRGTYIRNLLKAVEYANVNALSDSWHQLDMLESDRSITIGWIRKLLNVRKNLVNGNLYDFYLFVKNELNLKIPNLRKGEIKGFYDTHSYMRMALSIQIADITSLHKTIHKSKGEEYNSVMLILNDVKDLSFLMKPNIYSNKVHRVYYVAISRAVKNLYISVPNLDSNIEREISKIPITIKRLE